jgi:autotransporter-associated beta strand protein
LDGCGFQVTVTVTTGQPVYVHGGLFGSPYEACTVITTFFLCNDEFHVTPAPCSGNLQNVTIEVCWEDGSPDETLRFHCCQDTTYLLGNCGCDCVTTLLYEGDGCTSNAALLLLGDAIIDASGNGPLVLTSDITHGGSCQRTLTLDGTNAGGNELSGAITDGAGTAVDKDGPGLWRLSGASTYGGQLRILEGTFVVADEVGDFSGPFGGNPNILPQVGSDEAGFGRVALLSEGFTVDRSFFVPALAAGSFQDVILGGIGSGTARFPSSQAIQLGRDVTLQASTGGVAVFASVWEGASGPSGPPPAVTFTIGSPGNAGTVVLASNLPTSITGVNVVEGTARLQGNERIKSGTPVTLGSAGASVTFDLNGNSQSLESLSFTGTGSEVVGGTLKTLGTVVAHGTGHEISSAVSLDAITTFNVTSTLLLSGSVSGSAAITKSGAGTLTISGAITYTGETSIVDGTLIVENEFANSADISSVTFTATTLTVAFTTTPVSAATYQLLGGSTAQTYGVGAVTLTGAGGATGTYNSATSTLTID